MITSPIAQQTRISFSSGAIGSHSANWRSAFSSPNPKPAEAIQPHKGWARNVALQVIVGREAK